MTEKTKQFLLYLIKKNPRSSITSLMKLAYLADLISVKKTNKQISNLEYRRYTYGPFDQRIYSFVENFVGEGLIKIENDYGLTGEEFNVFLLNPEKEKDIKFDKLTTKNLEVIDSLLAQVKGYGARALTEIAYKTKPMRELKATLGGTEHLGRRLNLKV